MIPLLVAALLALVPVSNDPVSNDPASNDPVSDGGDHWPQGRGPAQTGVGAASDLPATWGPETNVVWKTPMPSWSGASPIVWGERIFVMSPSAPAPRESGADDEQDAADEGRGRRGRRGGGRDPGGDELLLLCVAKGDGKVLWQRKLDEGNRLHRKGNNTSPSPVTDGEHVWAVTGTGQVTALAMDGSVAWTRNLQEDYGSFGHNWGYACSPLLAGGKLVVEVLHGMNTDDPSYVVAFDAATGKTLWKVERATDAPRESPDAYTTPLLVRHGEHEQIVVSGGDVVTGHDPASGKELWRVDALNPRNAPNYRIVASPLAANGIVYAPTRERPLTAIALGDDARPDEKSIVWQWDERGAPDVPTPVCDGELFYMVADDGMATCLDAKTGAVVWGPERTVPGTVSSSPVLADGKLWFTTEEAVTVVLAAGRKFEILATNELDGSYTLSSPVPTDGRLIARTGNFLYCIAEPEREAESETDTEDR